MTKSKSAENPQKPVWLKIKEEELIGIIKKLAEKHDAPKIGLILRDQYGIPTTKIYGKKLSKYLKEMGIDSKIELKNAEKKVEKLREHHKKNITDRKAKHKFQKAQSRLNIIKKYHKIPIKRKKI